MRTRRELLKLVEVSEAGGTAAAGARDHVKDLLESIADADRRCIVFQQLFAIADVTNYVTEENAAEARAVEGACSWVQASMQALRIEIDVVETEMDELGGKKARRDVAHHAHLVRVAKAHKLHIARLERLARLLVRGDITPEMAEEVRGPVCEYVAKVEKTRAGLGQFADEESLEASFELYGAIEQLQLRENDDGDSDGYGSSSDINSVDASFVTSATDASTSPLGKQSNRRSSMTSASEKPSRVDRSNIGTSALNTSGSGDKRLRADKSLGHTVESQRRLDGAFPISAAGSAQGASNTPAIAPRQIPTTLAPVKWGSLNATLRLQAAAASVGPTITAVATSAAVNVVKESALDRQLPSSSDELSFDLDAAQHLCWFSFGCADETCKFLHIGLAKCSNESLDGSVPCPWHLRRSCRFLHVDQERFIERDRSTIVRLLKGFPLEVGCSSDGGVRVSAPLIYTSSQSVPAAFLSPQSSVNGLGIAESYADADYSVLTRPTQLFPDSSLGLVAGRGTALLPSVADSAIGLLPGALISFEDSQNATVSAPSLWDQVLAVDAGASVRRAVGSQEQLMSQPKRGSPSYEIQESLMEFERTSTASFSSLVAGGPAPAMIDMHDGFSETQVRFPVELGLRDYTRQLVSLFSRGIEARFTTSTAVVRAIKSAWLANLSAEQCWDEHQLLRCCNMHQQTPGFLCDLAGRALDGLSLTEQRVLSEGLAYFYNVRTWQAHTEVGVAAVPSTSPFVISSVGALHAAAGIAIAVFAVLAAADAAPLRNSALPVLHSLVTMRCQIRAHFASQTQRTNFSLAVTPKTIPQALPARRLVGASFEGTVMMAGFEHPANRLVSPNSHIDIAAPTLLIAASSPAALVGGSDRNTSEGCDRAVSETAVASSFLSSVQLAEAPAQAFLRSNTAVYLWLRSRHAITRSGVMLCSPLVLDDIEIPFKDSATLMALAMHGFITDS